MAQFDTDIRQQIRRTKKFGIRIIQQQFTPNGDQKLERSALTANLKSQLLRNPAQKFASRFYWRILDMLANRFLWLEVPLKGESTLLSRTVNKHR